MKNGAKKSNLEDAKIYVGKLTDDGTLDEKLCA